ncbi:hypothetical protein X975_08886, partial [Stegodyphus mimosarum]
MKMTNIPIVLNIIRRAKFIFHFTFPAFISCYKITLGLFLNWQSFIYESERFACIYSICLLIKGMKAV